MSGWQRYLSAFCVAFFCAGYCSLIQGDQRPVLGIVPFQFAYPTKTFDWAGYFLQEALTHQMVLSRKFAPRSATTMQLWSQKLEIAAFEKVTANTLIKIGLQQLILGELQKVLEYASLRGTFFFLDQNQQFQQVSFQSTFAWGSVDEVIAALFQSLSKIAPSFSDFTPFPQGYQWESLEAFYYWKLQPKRALGSPEWQQYKEELEALLSHYPDIARLIYPELAALLLLEGTQPVINDRLLKQAQDTIQEALRLDPKNDHHYALLSQIYYFQEDKQSAKSEAVIANAHNPQNAIAQILYGLTISRTPQEQEKHILGGLQKNPFLQEFPLFADRNLAVYETMLPLLNSWDASSPKNPKISTNAYNTAMMAGQEYFSQKQWELAQKRFEQATVLQPQQLDPQLYLIRIALAQKQYKAALAPLSQLQEQFPENDRVLLYLGLTHERLKSFNEAEDLYRQVLFLKADHPQALLRLGTVLIKTKQYPEAQNYLDTLVRKYPDYSVGWWNLGLLYAQKKQWKKAETAVKEALRLDPNNSKIQKMLTTIQEKIK